MLTRILVAGALSAALAACGSFSGDSARMTGTSGSSGAYAAVPSGASDSRPVTAGPLGGIDNGEYPGARQGAVPMAGSSGGVGAGPPGGIANNQMDRISQ
jgi:hypothetical protein